MQYAKYEINQNSIKWLNSLYELVETGVAGMDSANKLAERYLKKYGDPKLAVDALIADETLKASSAGFLTGLGGLLFTPISLPANLIGVLFLQMRMVSSIGILAKVEVNPERMKLITFGCLCGAHSKHYIQKICFQLLTKSTQSLAEEVLVRNIAKTITAIIASQSSAKVLKAIPLVGALVGGGIDYYVTRSIGNFTKQLLLEKPTDLMILR